MQPKAWATESARLGIPSTVRPRSITVVPWMDVTGSRLRRNTIVVTTAPPSISIRPDDGRPDPRDHAQRSKSWLAFMDPGRAFLAKSNFRDLSQPLWAWIVARKPQARYALRCGRAHTLTREGVRHARHSLKGRPFALAAQIARDRHLLGVGRHLSRDCQRPALAACKAVGRRGSASVEPWTYYAASSEAAQRSPSRLPRSVRRDRW
jgi:hypothetical protein